MTFTRPWSVDAAFPNASDHRKNLGTIYPRKGIFPDPVTTSGSGIAYAGSGWNINARPFTAAVKRGDAPYGTGYGTALVTNDGVVTNAWTISPAPSSGSRIDILCILVRDVTQGESATGAPTDGPGGAVRSGYAEFVVVAGVPGTPGIRPSVPSGYLEIAEVNVSSGAASAAGATITRTYPFAQVNGGVIYTHFTSEVPNLTDPLRGDVAIALDSGQAWRYNGTRWGRFGQSVSATRGGSNETGTLLQPGGSVAIATLSLPTPAMRGAIVRMFASAYIYNPAAVDVAGYIRFTADAAQVDRRWHTRGRMGVLMPSAMVEVKLAADVATATSAQIALISDAASGSPVEVFNTIYSIVYDYLGE